MMFHFNFDFKGFIEIETTITSDHRRSVNLFTESLLVIFFWVRWEYFLFYNVRYLYRLVSFLLSVIIDVRIRINRILEY